MTLLMDARSCHRQPGRAARAAVAVAVLALAVGCGGPRSVPLADLAVDMERYDGREIMTQGVVVEFDEEDGALFRHFVVQDAHMNRVELVPAERVEPYVGSAVEVAGDFEFDPNRGRLLRVDTIEPLRSGDHD